MHYGVQTGVFVTMRTSLSDAVIKVSTLISRFQNTLLKVINISIRHTELYTLFISDARRESNNEEESNRNSKDAFKFTSIPMTLNPHIQKLFVRNTSLERLDATLQFYPNLEQLDLGGNKIKVHL